MWTTASANRVSTVFDVLGCLTLLGLVIDAAIDRAWNRVTVTVVVGLIVLAVLIYQRRWRRSHSSALAPLADGRAVDERGAYIQLRAWALTGQIAAAGTLVMLLVEISGGTPGLWFWSFLGLGMVNQLSGGWLSQRV